jgi:hypothetical protein
MQSLSTLCCVLLEEYQRFQGLKDLPNGQIRVKKYMPEFTLVDAIARENVIHFECWNEDVEPNDLKSIYIPFISGNLQSIAE